MSEEPKLEELDRLISMGKQKGFLTYDEVNDALPSDLVSLDQLDDIMMMFGAMDIEVVDSAKAGRLPSEVRAAQQAQPDDDDGDGLADCDDDASLPVLSRGWILPALKKRGRPRSGRPHGSRA